MAHARSMMSMAASDKKFWTEAVNMASYFVNHFPLLLLVENFQKDVLIGKLFVIFVECLS